MAPRVGMPAGTGLVKYYSDNHVRNFQLYIRLVSVIQSTPLFDHSAIQHSVFRCD